MPKDKWIDMLENDDHPDVFTRETTKAGERTQHTPGPWKYGGKHTNEIFAPSGKAICQVYFKLFGCTDDAANARLIAAAPELLALVRAWAISDPQGTHADKCRAAIAKVEGSNAAKE